MSKIKCSGWSTSLTYYSVRSPAAACCCSDWNCCWAAGDGPSPTAVAGVPTPASEPGTPLLERTRLVLVSMSGGESILYPLAWVSNSIGPARPLGYIRENGNPHWRRTADPGVPGPPPKGKFPSGEGEGGVDPGPAGSVAMDPGSPAAATFDLTGVVSETGWAETGTTSSGLTSPDLWALDLV